MADKKDAVSRIVLVAGPDPGHVFPVTALASALVAAGHDVAVATAESRHALVAATGAAPLPLPGIAPTDRDDDVGYLLWERAAAMAGPLTRSLEHDPPDLVVADTLTRAGAFAADLLGRPWVEVIPHFIYDPADDVPPVGLGRIPSRRPWRVWADDSIRRHQRRSLAIADHQRRAARTSIGLDPAAGAPRLRLACTLPALEHPRRAWPPDAYVVGDLGWEPDWPRLAPPSGDAPLVVVTDSTASGVARSLGEVAHAAFAGSVLRTVITTDRPLTSTDANMVVGRGPHGPLLDHAAVAVGFGGHGFVTKALARGVPMVIVPLHGDQRETGARVTAADAGVTLPLARLTARRLRRAVEHVAGSPRLRAGAARVAAGQQGLGADRAVALIEGVLRRSGPRGSP